MLLQTPCDTHPVSALDDLRQSLQFTIGQTIADLAAIQFPAKSAQTAASLQAVAQQLKSLGEIAQYDGEALAARVAVSQRIEQLRRQIPGLQPASELSPTVIEHGHLRRCHDCGNVAEHTDSVVPAVLCPKCGSRDTRRLRQQTEVLP